MEKYSYFEQIVWNNITTPSGKDAVEIVGSIDIAKKPPEWREKFKMLGIEQLDLVLKFFTGRDDSFQLFSVGIRKTKNGQVETENFSTEKAIEQLKQVYANQPVSL